MLPKFKKDVTFESENKIVTGCIVMFANIFRIKPLDLINAYGV